jgi:ABC-2 type transport system ATP-binding protein
MAQAILHDPEVLILDEPTIGLDPEQVIEIRNLIKGMDSNRTVLLSTHILHDVSIICSRVIIIDQGKLIAEDTPENLMHQLQRVSSLHVQIEGPKDRIMYELEKIHGVMKIEIKEIVSENVCSYIIETEKEENISIKISNAIFSNNWGLIEIKPVLMSLEDIFLKVIHRN